MNYDKDCYPCEEKKEVIALMKSKLTVAMPVYNTESFVRESIDSILSQTYEEFEFLIIDDCSNDHSVEVIKDVGDKRIRLIELSEKLSIPEVRNLGLELANGEYVAFMDSDDLVTPTRLAEQVQFLDENKEVVAVSSDFEFFGSFEQYRTMPSGSQNIRLLSMFRCCLQNSAAMIRHDRIKKAGIKHREDYFVCSDYAFWVDLTAIGELENINKCFLKYRQGHNNITRNSWTNPELRNKRKDILDKIHETAFKNNKFQINNNELFTFNSFFGDCNTIIPDATQFAELLALFDKMRKQASRLKIDERLLDSILNEMAFHAKKRMEYNESYFARFTL